MSSITVFDETQNPWSELCSSYKEYNTIILCLGQLMAIVA